LYLSKKFKFYRSVRFKNENDFISNVIDEKLYLVSNYNLGIELYKVNNSEKLLIKIIELSGNIEQIKDLYKYCKTDKLNEILLLKHI